MKRRLFTLALFLLLGAVLNVAVAWSALLVWPPSLHPNNSEILPTSATCEIVSSYFQVHKIEDCICYGDHEWRIGWSLIYAACGVDEDDPGQFLVVETLMAGWPVFSMVGRHYWEIDHLTYENTLMVPDWIRERVSRLLVYFPLRPIWPGFIINTAFYTAILWLLNPGPFAFRRHIRCKRGHCIKCGYDLSHADHAACPECGAGA